MFKTIGIFIFLFSGVISFGSKTENIKVGAEQAEEYLSLLKDKKIAAVVNHTAQVKNIHLVDFLLENGLEVETIFAPEHGFRGDASAGEVVKDGVDSKTGIPVISLYGEVKKPTSDHLKNIDIVVFDIQDVGCRFYTYISTLKLVLEACAENEVQLLVLDRPNPNGDYVAGPVLEKEFESFVGMLPIPVVHGCTVGELALMINGETWHNAGSNCQLTVVPVKNYTHSTTFKLPVKPSPNLPNYISVRLYPSLCFFEATSISVGRGTEFPFQVLGGLQPDLGNFTFTPKSISGVAINPLHNGQKCFGVDLRNLENIPTFTLSYFLDFYKKFESESEFLTRERWFNLLAGTGDLINQIREGKTETEIMRSWQTGLNEYKTIRKKYLLYPDFE